MYYFHSELISFNSASKMFDCLSNVCHFTANDIFIPPSGRFQNWECSAFGNIVVSSALSEPDSRPGIGENLKTFPAPRFTFDTPAKKTSHFQTVTEW
ncbi:hypothetical protein Y032_0004g1761 [Ancylostoma ceylanicum]|uniref:Uncharacterized protein n=1 Tax=Ancylostoma ceylanicum TaxID=53326 RepID=A0A016VUP2_9BILA|nr:hypothetical protein Y032_0004g1761 [Ancylostoma ceylanicum]